MEIVRNALIAVNKGGTGTRVFAGAPYSSAGKTGTAQAVSLGQNVKYNAKLLEEHQRDHSLYAAFAPAEAPEIAVAVIVENAGFGAAHAAPIARRVFDYWLLGDYPSEEDIAAVRKARRLPPGQAAQGGRHCAAHSLSFAIKLRAGCACGISARATFGMKSGAVPVAVQGSVA